MAEYVDRQYTGAKAALRPIYDALAAAATGFGDDVTVEGRGTYTPLVRGRQFVAVAAATRDRVDLGLRFTNPPVSARLQPATGPGHAQDRAARRGRRGWRGPPSAAGGLRTKPGSVIRRSGNGGYEQTRHPLCVRTRNTP